MVVFDIEHYPSYFPLLGVNSSVVLYLKDGLHRTHHGLNRTMVKIIRKKKKEGKKSQEKKTTLQCLGLEFTDSVSELSTQSTRPRRPAISVNTS